MIYYDNIWILWPIWWLFDMSGGSDYFITSQETSKVRSTTTNKACFPRLWHPTNTWNMSTYLGVEPNPMLYHLPRQNGHVKQCWTHCQRYTLTLNTSRCTAHFQANLSLLLSLNPTESPCNPHCIPMVSIFSVIHGHLWTSVLRRCRSTSYGTLHWSARGTLGTPAETPPVENAKMGHGDSIQIRSFL